MSIMNGILAGVFATLTYLSADKGRDKVMGFFAICTLIALIFGK